ncbi:hypothetical protein SDC9_116914 [bioreactor metagenome]|uniref:Uncharacterized protein n=1 Tax=bioreactor metagenome TaxID=1076179 RepID=A0A645BWR9_9ZZZZ
MDLQIPDAGLRAGWRQLRRISLVHGPFDESSGDHRAEAVHGKHPVHGQAERHPQIFFLRVQHQLVQGLLQLRNPLSGIGGDGVDGLALQKRPSHPLGDLLLHQLQPLRIHHIGLRDDHKAVLNAKQSQNAQMLHGLGHKSLIRSHHQHGKVNAAGARQHIFDKFLVARHVYDARLRPVPKIQMGEAQLDGDASLLLLLKAVGVDAGQGLDEQSLAVVHMACGANDDMLHRAVSDKACTIQANSSSRRVRASSR